MQCVGRVLMLHEMEAPMQDLLVGMAGVVLDKGDDHACCASMPWLLLCWPALVRALKLCPSCLLAESLQSCASSGCCLPRLFHCNP